MDIEYFVPRDAVDLVINAYSVLLFSIGAVTGLITIHRDLDYIGIVLALLLLVFGFVVDELRGLR